MKPIRLKRVRDMKRDELFELVLKIYLDYLAEYERLDEWERGKMIWVGVRTLWERGRRRRMLPPGTSFNEFWEAVRRLDGYRGVVVEVHPLYWDRPELGAAIAIVNPRPRGWPP